MPWNLNIKRLIVIGLAFSFLGSLIQPSYAQEKFPIAYSATGEDFRLPPPGVMIHLSPQFNPPVLKGIKVHPDNPFRFDFILDRGDSTLTNDQLKDESTKLIKYFLTSLTIPEKDLWVNLSPYEKDRIIPRSFGLTEMGRDLLAEDYMLKQITASLIYPEDGIGKKFWNRIYQEAEKKFGTTNIPVNTFNKVWIVPEKAVVYENAEAGTAYVVESKLKVMLEQDYLSLERHEGIQSEETQIKDTNQLGSQIVREIVIPELTKEVNEDKNFVPLRQVYNSLILATWYKKKIKDSILERVYADKSKVAGVNTGDPNEKQRIYERYLQAFKKGVFNYIRDQQDSVTLEIVPKKYFSGGIEATDLSEVALHIVPKIDHAQLNSKTAIQITADIAMVSGLKSWLRAYKYKKALANRPKIRIPFYLHNGEKIEVDTLGMVLMPEGKPLFYQDLRSVLQSVNKIGVDTEKLLKDWEEYKIAILVGGQYVSPDEGYSSSIYVHNNEEIRIMPMPSPVRNVRIENPDKTHYSIRAYRWDQSSRNKKDYNVTIWDDHLSKPIGRYTFVINGLHLELKSKFYRGSIPGFYIRDSDLQEEQNRSLGFLMMKEGMGLAQHEKVESFDWQDIIKFAVDSSQQEEIINNELQSASQDKAKVEGLFKDVGKAKQFLDQIEARALSDGQLSENRGWSAEYANYQLKLWYVAVLSILQHSFQPLDEEEQNDLIREIFKEAKFVPGKQSFSDFMTGYGWDTKKDMLTTMAHELGHNIIYLIARSEKEKNLGLLELEKKFHEKIKDIDAKNEYLSDIISYAFLETMGLGSAVQGRIESIFREGGLLTIGSSHQNARIKILNMTASFKVIQWSLLAKLGLNLYHLEPDLSFDEFHERLLKKYRESIGDKALLVENNEKKSNMGGIDFNTEQLNLKIQNNGAEIKFHIDPAMLQRLQNAPGFVPVIINIQPMTDLKGFLGLEYERHL